MADIKIVKICGGLGNQMFQYAFGLALEKKGNRVLYDTSNFYIKTKKSKEKRKLELTHFNVDLPIATSAQIKKVFKKHICGIKIPKILRSSLSKEIKDKNHYDYNPAFLETKGSAFFTGTFANERYFESYRPEILQAFTLKTPLTPSNQKMMEKIKSCESVSIHIRRGDYVKLGWTCDLSYYERSIETIQKQVPHPHFFIFSDDIAWVRENLKITQEHTFVDINDGDTGYFDLELMKNCKHNICANSTFSWWAGYLNENPNKIVLLPDNVYSPRFFEKKKVAILCIETGRYNVFWDDLYRSCEKYFLPAHEKTYFLFTDDKTIKPTKNVHLVPHQFLGWPEETLFRFKTFLKVEKELEKFDYIYFLNGTIGVRRTVTAEIFPSEEQGLMGALHPQFYCKPRHEYTYDNNPDSLAYIAPNQGKHYFMGGFNGGTGKAFLKLIRDLDKAIQIDYDKKIVALWHDESHLNKYLLDKNPLVIPAGYLVPEGKKISSLSDCYKMILKDKKSIQYGGHDYMRGLSDKKQQSPLVSVLMPVYNTKQEYVRAAIDSILEQTYSHFELIILDDGSNPESKIDSLVQSYSDTRIRYYKNTENKGLVYSRNRLLDLAKGTYVAFLDSDDVSMPDRLNVEVQYLQDHPSVGVVGSWFEYTPRYRLLKFPKKHFAIVWRMLIKGQNVIGNSTAMFRRDLIEKFNLKYKTGYDAVEDFDFWLNLLDKTKFYVIPQSLLIYRHHENNVSNRNKERNNRLIKDMLKHHRKRFFVEKIKHLFKKDKKA